MDDLLLGQRFEDPSGETVVVVVNPRGIQILCWTQKGEGPYVQQAWTHEGFADLRSSPFAHVPRLDRKVRKLNEKCLEKLNFDQPETKPKAHAQEAGMSYRAAPAPIERKPGPPVAQWNKDLIREYLDKGWSMDGLDVANRSALVTAVNSLDEDLVREVLASGVDPDLITEDHQTALHHACNVSHLGRLKPVKMLLDAGADAQILGWNDRTCLHYVGYADEPEMVALLLEAGVHPDAGTKRHATPLMEMVKFSRHEIVEMLLDAGADINRANYFGSALGIARSDKMRAFLKERGATVLKRRGDIRPERKERKSPMKRLALIAIGLLLVALGCAWALGQLDGS